MPDDAMSESMPLTVRTPWSHPHLPPSPSRALPSPLESGGATVRTPWSHPIVAETRLVDESPGQHASLPERVQRRSTRRWLRAAPAGA